MSEIVEHGDSGNARPIPSANNSPAFSIKEYQAIYHQITGRTEQIKKRYTDNVLLDMTDLEQLHHKICQLCDVHNVVASNETISVFHNKDRKEQFTSFDRFRAYNANATNPCVNVVFKYNFSIIPGGLQRPHPQEYVVAIRLTSRVGLMAQAEEDAPPFMRGHLWSFILDHTAEITVDYTDYVVARGFVEAFDEWLRGCKSIPKTVWLNRLRAFSNFIPKALQLIMVVLIAYFALHSIPEYFSADSTVDKWARFSVIYLAASFVVLKIASMAGDLIEEAVDTYPTLSYLKLNKGDERLIERFGVQKVGKIIMAISGALMSIVLGIISAKLEKLL